MAKLTNTDAMRVKALKEGRTDTQKSVIDYFFLDTKASSGCLASEAKPITDQAFDELLASKIKEINIETKALEKTGVDASEVQEVKPVFLQGYEFGEPDALIHRGKDGVWRCSHYQLTMIYFSSKQIFFYQYSFNLINDETTEFTDEYFYKDITNFSTTLETREKRVDVHAGGCLSNDTKPKIEIVQYSSFRLVVPNDVKKCSMTSSNELEQTIAGIKNKLRDKKSE